jgi:type III pantothenate kinase
MSILVLDIGNTRFKWGLFASASPDSELLASGACALEEIEAIAEPQFSRLARPSRIIGCVVAGEVVKRRVVGLMQHWATLGTKPQWITSQREQCDVKNGYDYPWLLGADRWAALIGARVHAQGQAALVVSVGTAVTVDSLDAAGMYIGGLILPGFGLMLRALEMGTAGLRVPMGEVVDFPRNTSDALMSGGAQAITGAVERQYRLLEKRVGTVPKLLISGGAAVKLSPTLDMPYEHVEHLVFEGLLRIAAESPAPAAAPAMQAK